MPEIWDACMFFNELDMLELRFNILDAVVDHFVVCEAEETHSGNPKPLYLLENYERFKRFHHKLICVNAGKLTLYSDNSWTRERYHRSRIADALIDAEPDDWILVSDVDEIPSPEAVAELVRCYWLNRVKLELTMYYYSLNWRVDQGWAIGAYRYAIESDPNRIRACADGLAVPVLPSGKMTAGWHFSWFNGTQAILDKQAAFMHANDPIIRDMPRDPQWIDQTVKAGRDLFNRDNMRMAHVPLSDDLPRYILDNVEKYRAMGWVSE